MLYWFAQSVGIIVIVALKCKAYICLSLTINLLCNHTVALKL
jgi:hypothetical protein